MLLRLLFVVVLIVWVSNWFRFTVVYTCLFDVVYLCFVLYGFTVSGLFELFDVPSVPLCSGVNFCLNLGLMLVLGLISWFVDCYFWCVSFVGFR